MNRLTFSTVIDADKTTIWNALWDKNAYRNWASVFFEGSHARTDHWEEGSIVHFLGPDQSGIYSRIEKHTPNEIMLFRHIGNVVDGKEQPVDDATKKWTGATESYTLLEGKDGITLTIEIDIMDEHLEFMTAAFPKALEKVKSSCEQQN